MIGKILFPQLPADLRRRRTNELMLTLLVGLILATVVAVVMLTAGRPGKH